MGDAFGMRIIISTRCLINRPAGIGHYTAEMARALARRSHQSQYQEGLKNHLSKGLLPLVV
jgi:hypothetical protein